MSATATTFTPVNTHSLEPISLDALKKVVSFESIYLLVWAFTFGASVWVSFIGTNITEKAFTKQEFHHYMKRTMPKYFQAIISASLGLFLGWTYFHPDVLPNIFKLQYSDVLQQHVLLSVIVLQAFNNFIIGPAMDKARKPQSPTRQIEEKAGYGTEGRGESHISGGVPTTTEGVHQRASEIGKDLQHLSRDPSILPKIGMGANTLAITALAFHGFWIANYGIKY